MPDGTYQPKTYRKQGGDELVVASGGTLTLEAGATMAAAVALKSSSPSAGVGYATGAGGAVTQITSATTGVTLDKVSGAITTVTQNIAAGGEVAFTVTDAQVEVGDVVIASIRSGSVGGTTIAAVTAVAAGSFQLTLTNLHATVAETGALIINFAVIKAVGA